MGLRRDFLEVIVTELKFLAFRAVRPDMKRLRWHYLALGLVCSWLAGLGRYWDTPEAQWWQYAGLGSVVYTFFMAALLFALILPMQPRNWTYMNVLTFVGMTAPPAMLYAIPVERFVAPQTASQVNLTFLLVVSVWRVALLWRYLRGAAGLSPPAAFLALSLPLALILALLGYFQFTAIVMEGMMGSRGGAHAPNLAGRAVVGLGFGALFALPFLFLGYLILAARLDERARQRRCLEATTADDAEALVDADSPDDAG